MKESEIDSNKLIPIEGNGGIFYKYLKFREEDIREPTIVVQNPNNSDRFFICDGSHRAAARHYQRKKVKVRIIENDDDIKELKLEDIQTMSDLIGYCSRGNSSYPMGENANLSDWVYRTEEEEIIRYNGVIEIIKKPKIIELICRENYFETGEIEYLLEKYAQRHYLFEKTSGAG